MELYCNHLLRSAAVTFDFSFGYCNIYPYSLRGQAIETHFTGLSANPPSARDRLSLPGDHQTPLWILAHPAKDNLPTVELGRSCIRYVRTRYSRYYIELSTTFEQYLKDLGRKKRCELRRKMRKFARPGSIFFREYRSPEEIRSFYEPSLMVSRLSFQKRLGHGLPEDPEFLRHLMRLAEQDAVRGYLLFCDERPAAFMLCYVNGAWLTGERCGYDPSLAQLSPGSALIGYMLEHLFAEQAFRMFDFGAGESDYKAFFATGSFPCADVYYFPWNVRNLAFVIAHSTNVALWQLTAAVLDALHVKDWLKKLARNGWERPRKPYAIKNDTCATARQTN